MQNVIYVFAFFPFMGQISIRIPEEDVELLRIISNQTNTPIASLYRQATNEALREWKLDKLIELYEQGSLGLKKAWKLSNLTWNAFLLELEKRETDPPITELIDSFTDQVRENIQLDNHKK